MQSIVSVPLVESIRRRDLNAFFACIDARSDVGGLSSDVQAILKNDFSIAAAMISDESFFQRTSEVTRSLVEKMRAIVHSADGEFYRGARFAVLDKLLEMIRETVPQPTEERIWENSSCPIPKLIPMYTDVAPSDKRFFEAIQNLILCSFLTDDEDLLERIIDEGFMYFQRTTINNLTGLILTIRFENEAYPEEASIPYEAEKVLRRLICIPRSPRCFSVVDRHFIQPATSMEITSTEGAIRGEVRPFEHLLSLINWIHVRRDYWCISIDPDCVTFHRGYHSSINSKALAPLIEPLLEVDPMELAKVVDGLVPWYAFSYYLAWIARSRPHFEASFNFTPGRSYVREQVFIEAILIWMAEGDSRYEWILEEIVGSSAFFKCIPKCYLHRSIERRIREFIRSKVASTEGAGVSSTEGATAVSESTTREETTSTASSESTTREETTSER